MTADEDPRPAAPPPRSDDPAPPTASGRTVAIALVVALLAALVAIVAWVRSDWRANLEADVQARLEEAKRAAAEREAAAERRRVDAVEAGAGAPREQPRLPLLPAREAPDFAQAVDAARRELVPALEGGGAEEALPHARLAYVVARAGDGKAALKLANRALDLDPLLAAGWTARAYAWHELGEPSRIEQDLRRAERLAPDAPGPWLLRGEVAEARGDAPAAAAAYRRALEAGLPGALAASTRRRVEALTSR